MNIRLERIHGGSESTIGTLWIDDAFACFTLEDQRQAVKVYAETRIPAGRYPLRLRHYGRFHERYRRLFSSIHAGVIELLDVPQFSDILIHCGNIDNETAGCLLVGDGAIQNVTRRGSLLHSRDAYYRIYPPIAAAIQAAGRADVVSIQIFDPPHLGDDL